MREQMLTILTRLASVRENLGDEAFEQACRRARVAIGAVALEVAIERSRRPAAPQVKTAPVVNRES
nr:hypothetical protein [uncultured Devosia sp.]